MDPIRKLIEDKIAAKGWSDGDLVRRFAGHGYAPRDLTVYRLKSGDCYDPRALALLFDFLSISEAEFRRRRWRNSTPRWTVRP